MTHSSERLIGFLAIVVFSCPGQPRATQPAQAGVVVEEVSKDSAGEKADIRAGDILLTWERLASPPANPEPATGKIGSAFDWLWVEMEHGPRGTVKVTAERDGKGIMFEVPVGIWGIRCVPGSMTKLSRRMPKGRPP